MSWRVQHNSMLPSRLEDCLAVYISAGSHRGSWLPRACLGKPVICGLRNPSCCSLLKYHFAFCHGDTLVNSPASTPATIWVLLWHTETSGLPPHLVLDQTLWPRAAIPTHLSRTPPAPRSELYSTAWSPCWMQYRADQMVPWERSSLLRGHPGKWGPQPGILGVLKTTLEFLSSLTSQVWSRWGGRKESEHSQTDPCLPFLALVLESFPKSQNNCTSCRTETSLLSYLHSAVPCDSLNDHPTSRSFDFLMCKNSSLGRFKKTLSSQKVWL